MRLATVQNLSSLNRNYKSCLRQSLRLRKQPKGGCLSEAAGINVID